MEFSIPVCYLMIGTDQIFWGDAVSVQNDVLFFKGNGHNPLESCFLTENQCRKHHNLPNVEEDVHGKEIESCP